MLRAVRPEVPLRREGKFSSLPRRRGVGARGRCRDERCGTRGPLGGRPARVHGLTVHGGRRRTVKAFFDTSVLVGAFYGDHPRHEACLQLLEDASKKTHFCVAHSVTELYAAMTRLARAPPDHLGTGATLCGEHPGLLFGHHRLGGRALRGRGGSGPARPRRQQKVYDLLTLKCALKAGAERVYP
jgi:hypothetical protein